MPYFSDSYRPCDDKRHIPMLRAPRCFKCRRPQYETTVYPVGPDRRDPPHLCSDCDTLNIHIRREIRRAIETRVLGASKSCAGCGTTLIRALFDGKRVKGKRYCYECVTQGPGSTEGDHPVGRKQFPDHVVDMPANWHRVVSERLDGPAARLYYMQQQQADELRSRLGIRARRPRQ